MRMVLLAVSGLLASCAATAVAAEKTYRLKEVDLKTPILWGPECREPEGKGLAFGGEDQDAEDGCAHTRILVGGQWKDIHEELRAANRFQKSHDLVWAIRNQVKSIAARARAIWFRGLLASEEQAAVKADLLPAVEKALGDLKPLVPVDKRSSAKPDAEESAWISWEEVLLRSAQEKLAPVPAALQGGVSPDAVSRLGTAQIELEKAAEMLDAEPPPRAMSPIVYDAKTDLYVLFGGDHLDYLTNDTWVFDPAKKRWGHCYPVPAPVPRAGHELRKAGEGKIVLSGGYTYALNTDYMGGQYKDVGDGEWTYDVATSTWTGTGKEEVRDTRVYRTGPFHPDFFLQGPKPDAPGGEAWLKEIPANKWVERKPPQVPRQNRDWGSITLDPDRGQILVWSGGHCAHGGTDVLHYHLATGRWELPFPVEFPLGQLYSNTSYPRGYNFNGRPWVTGHTYQNYAYDLLSKQLLFTGETKFCYLYDPDQADWAGRIAKPAGMVYGDCFYTLTLCPTPQGTFCWAKEGKVFRFDPAVKAWAEVKVEGKLPPPSVDYSTVAYDSKRNRLVFFRADYGKKYTGQVWALDLKTFAATELSPANMAAAAATTFGLDRACYEPQGDLVLMGTLLPSDADGFQRTPAYDCAANRWVSLRIGYEAAGDKKTPQTPRGHSSGIVYDAKRKLVWGVETGRVAVFVLRLDAAKADVAEMK